MVKLHDFFTYVIQIAHIKIYFIHNDMFSNNQVIIFLGNSAMILNIYLLYGFDQFKRADLSWFSTSSESTNDEEGSHLQFMQDALLEFVNGKLFLTAHIVCLEKFLINLWSAISFMQISWLDSQAKSDKLVSSLKFLLLQ